MQISKPARGVHASHALGYEKVGNGAIRKRLGSGIRRRLGVLALSVLAIVALAGPSAQASSPELVDTAVQAGINYSGSPLSLTPSWDASTVDYDSDGDEDFHISLHMKNEGMLFRNNGNGTFTRTAYVPGNVFLTVTPRVNETAKYIDRHACAWGDPNRDGRPDIACSAGRYDSNRVKDTYIDNELFLQNAPGSSPAFTDVSVAAGVSEPCGRGRFIAFIDVNRDGWDDLFVGNQRERDDPADPCNAAAMGYPINELSKLYLNRGLAADGTWAGYAFSDRWNTIGTATTVGFQYNSGSRCAIPWDYNHDGRMDLLTCTFSGHRPYLYRNDGTKFTEVSRTGSINLAAVNGVTVSDLNQDGIDDYLYSTASGFFYRRGTASGIASTVVRLGNYTLPSSSIGWSLAVGDINGDGRMDVYGQVGSATETGNPEDVVFVSTGSLTFQRYATPAAGGRADDVAAIRVGNRDGFLVLNGKLENPVPGPVQFITWNQ